MKIKRKISILLLFLLIVLACFIFFNHRSVKVDEKDKLIPKEKDYSLKLFMVGDALIHSGVYMDAEKPDGTYDFKPMLANLKPIISKYDLAYYNQETILGGKELGYSSYPMFNSPDEVGDAFIDAGFDLVSLATNHTMDKREIGVLNSVKYWKSKKNVVTSGQWDSWDERNKVRIYEKNNIKYAFFSYTTWTNGLNPPVGKEYLTNIYSDEKAKEDIEKVRDKVDVVLVAMHWGTEYSLGVSYDQEKIANYLSELGVDVIIGAHPHVVEPVEFINDGKTFVIYSLGNFISDQDGTERLTGLMSEITIKKHIDEEDNVTISLDNPRCELVYTYATRRPNSYNKNFKLYSYAKLNDNLLPNYQSYYDKYKGIVSSRYSELTWGLSGECLDGNLK